MLKINFCIDGIRIRHVIWYIRRGAKITQGKYRYLSWIVRYTLKRNECCQWKRLKCIRIKGDRVRRKALRIQNEEKKKNISYADSNARYRVQQIAFYIDTNASIIRMLDQKTFIWMIPSYNIYKVSSSSLVRFLHIHRILNYSILRFTICEQ